MYVCMYVHIIFSYSYLCMYSSRWQKSGRSMASLPNGTCPAATWTLFQHMKAAGLCWNCAANFARSDNCRTFPVDCNQSLKQLWILSWPKLDVHCIATHVWSSGCAIKHERRGLSLSLSSFIGNSFQLVHHLRPVCGKLCNICRKPHWYFMATS